jgi:hypothetical protein
MLREGVKAERQPQLYTEGQAQHWEKQRSTVNGTSRPLNMHFSEATNPDALIFHTEIQKQIVRRRGISRWIFRAYELGNRKVKYEKLQTPQTKTLVTTFRYGSVHTSALNACGKLL